MTREADGRLVISCDRCHARLDLGPANVARTQRSPSGWLATGPDKHLCGICAPADASRFMSVMR